MKRVDNVGLADEREENTEENQGTDRANTSQGSSSNEERVTFVKSKRKALRGKITRSINRIREAIQRKDTNDRRFVRELEEMRSDYGRTCNFHGELYSYVEESQVQKLDQWENDLIDDMHTIEEEVEDYLISLSERESEVEKEKGSTSGKSGSISTRSSSKKGQNTSEKNDVVPTVTIQEDNSKETENEHSETNINRTEQRNVNPIPTTSSESVSNSFSFDSWINNLVEFQETNMPSSVINLSVADVLYKLEASKDIPSVKLLKYDGNPLHYVDFIERFKIHIHDKPHLSDDMRMVQLRMHLTGDAERALCGLGSSGSMYATAIKMLQDQFGQPSLIARAIVNKLTKGAKIPPNNRNALRDLSIDLINSIATLKRLNHFADVNANENLRKIVMRLPGYLIEQWKSFVANLREKGDTPSVIHISDFIRQRVRAEFDPDFGDLERPKPDHRYEKSRENEKSRRGIYSQQTLKRTAKCYLCQEDHRISQCPTFLDSDVNDRIQKTKDMRLCFSCLVKGHNARECRSKRACGKNGCTRTHNELLHINPPVASACSHGAIDRDGILPVIRGIFRGSNGRLREGNILVDSGASTSVIRRDFAKALGLQGKHERLDVSVVGEEILQNANSRRLKFWLSSIDGGEEYPIEAYELEKTVTSVPALDRHWLQSFSHLSDLNFNHKAGPVDLILGIQYSHLHAELDNRQGLPFEPIARKSVLGWYVLGPDNTKRMSSVCSVNFMEKINLEKFYDFETIGIRSPNCSCPKEAISSNDKMAMEMFTASCKKVGERYEIALPWKNDPHMLPDNYPLAEKRLCSLEKNLLKNEDKAKMYDDVMQDYVRNNWAEPVNEESSDSSPVYYLPHHGVYRPDKTSTPLRIVFDPACVYRGTSLNSFLYKGPCLIGNLLGVLLRFREEVVSFVGDISKMYLQILLPESDTQVHRFLWRSLDVNRKPQIYRLLRVTFGDKPSPDMASYVILHIAAENQEEFPEAATVLQRDRYMDDLIHSCSSAEQAVQKIQDLDKILATGSFHIKEWYCSSETVREEIAKKEPSQKQTVISFDNEDIKTLGVVWNPMNDIIQFKVADLNVEVLTKRTVLSRISRIYDPLGLASAVTITARMAMQDVWRMKELGWDDPLPDTMCSLWKNIFGNLRQLDTVSYPRCLKPTAVSGKSVLHVFADASAKAYGAVAYLSWPSSEGPHVQLVSAKARVAPLQQTTIPRLELMAALVASRLATTIFQEFKEKPSRVIFWTDSQIVLHWIKADSLKFKAFVGVRIGEIQSAWNSDHWRYVPTSQNVADDLSRGISVNELGGRWLHGPSFLHGPENEWPENMKTAVSSELLERKRPKIIGMCSSVSNVIDSERFSSWKKLLRVTAYCFRFIFRLKQRLNGKISQMSETEDSLQCEEIEYAEMYWVKTAQSSLTEWETDYTDLAPFIANGIIRVGGRLRHTSALQYDEKHPILLPSRNHVSRLIMEDIHVKVAHAGQERTLGECRRKFWIVRGRNLAKCVVRNCVVCRKLRQPAHTTLMADLPPERLRPFSPPFSVTGVDLFGPFPLKYGRNKTTKAWGALFTCANVRAIHLEIVDGLSTQAFLQALRRFVARHGWPDTIISDNGTSFVGTQKELRNLVVEGRKEIENFAMLHKVKWKFITPLSPHQGGLYESLIKQAKRALSVAIGQQVLTWNEMSTAFAEAECLLNSRPLGYTSSDPNNLQPLTPNHFVLGRASADIPQGPYQETKNLHKRFEFVQMLVQQFWKRFIREYMPTLMRRAKWRFHGRQLQVGDVVLLVDYNSPRGKWDLARIVEEFPGHDGVVRNVRVKTKNGQYQRSVQKCCLILGHDNF